MLPVPARDPAVMRYTTRLRRERRMSTETLASPGLAAAQDPRELSVMSMTLPIALVSRSGTEPSPSHPPAAPPAKEPAAAPPPKEPTGAPPAAAPPPKEATTAPPPSAAPPPKEATAPPKDLGEREYVSTREQLEPILDEVFTLIDVNNDGGLSFEEVKAFICCVPDPPSDADIRAMFAAAGIAANAEVTKPAFADILRALESTAKLRASEISDCFRKRCLRRLFVLMDTNKDLSLSQREIEDKFRLLRKYCGKGESSNIPVQQISEQAVTEAFRAMGKEELGEDDFVRFVSNLCSGVPVSHIVNAMTRGAEESKRIMDARRALWS
eukprot:TRINITY_DN20965_c0_g1_i1.p2 TRINITY_DN20965_c0_g1~~TRINITY_DN20965_c0_g1_i1.p2  ORF type:complete len:326 (+),score=96.87 TRINITY_DN20965_c0_g1_i1:930-1907(+)